MFFLTTKTGEHEMSILETLRKKFPILVPPKKKADARVAIAKDVIATLKLNTVRACAGTYFEDNEGFDHMEEPFEAIALRMRQKYGQATCSACALGATVISAIGLYNKPGAVGKAWKENGGLDQHELHSVLGRWFTGIQLDLIECAFEEATHFVSGGSTLDDREKASAFGYEYNYDHDRLVAIMQNIVDNKGTFRP